MEENHEDWALSVLGLKDYYGLLSNFDKITYDEENGIHVTLSLSNKQCNDMIKHFNNIKLTGSIVSTNYWAMFIGYFVAHIQEYMSDQPVVYDE